MEHVEQFTNEMYLLIDWNTQMDHWFQSEQELLDSEVLENAGDSIFSDTKGMGYDIYHIRHVICPYNPRVTMTKSEIIYEVSTQTCLKRM